MPNLKLVIIHGSHKIGPAQFLKIGDPIEMSQEELLNLDPAFKNGIGHRFASPEKAAKLLAKAKLERELAESDPEAPYTEPDEDADESDEDEDEEPADEPEEVPEPAPAAPAKKKAKPAAKKKAGG